MEPVRKDMVEADLIDNMGIPEDYPTVANLLRVRPPHGPGYSTALYRKWHMGYFNTPEEKATKGATARGLGLWRTVTTSFSAFSAAVPIISPIPTGTVKPIFGKGKSRPQPKVTWVTY